MLLSALLIALALGLIVLAANLFTNAVEWLGYRLGLNEGAVGSVLAAVGTALPETMIPVIAILFIGSADSNEIGVGAIMGAPFLLSTAAFAVTGMGVIFFRKRRVHGTNLRLDEKALRRDLACFLVFYLSAIGASFLPGDITRYVVAGLLIAMYGVYVYIAFTGEGASVAANAEDLKPLYLHHYTGGIGAPPVTLVFAQFLGALGIMIAGAQIFVTDLESLSDTLHIPGLILALVVAPLATELPETLNSIIWIREEKDTLAMGNISGAMVLQSCLPVSLGIVFTEWELTEAALVSASIALTSVGVVYASVVRLGHLSGFVLLNAGFLWVGFVGYVVLKVAGD